MYVYVPGMHRSLNKSKSAIRFPEISITLAGSFLMWVLGIKTRSFGRAAVLSRAESCLQLFKWVLNEVFFMGLES